jgi:tRNA-specific 2-thiouridylase
MVHMDGRVLGRHEGVTRYTIGQRRGLNIAVGDPLFVVRIDADKRQVIVGPREALLTQALSLKEANWLGAEDSLEAAAANGAPVLARVRSTREPVPGRLALVEGQPRLVFDVLEEGVALLYDPAEERVLCFIVATNAPRCSLALRRELRVDVAANPVDCPCSRRRWARQHRLIAVEAVERAEFGSAS